MIHPSAVIHPKAQVDPSARIGPYVVIDEHVILGPDCIVGPHVHLTGHTVIGAHNRFHTGCVIGDAPQDLKYQDEPTRLRIGDDNVFREHCTVHRSNKPNEDTVIGSHGFFMQHAHVGHNSLVGNHAIVAGGALLAGHVTVEDRAFISGNCLVHQFVRVGTLALMQGGAAISKDLPPFVVARGGNGICGLNVVGLRRAGFSAPDRLELKRLYHHLFRSPGMLRERLESARALFGAEPSLRPIEFVAASRRGLCRDTGGRRPEESEEAEAD
ncbi:MAG TPA: acyl-ACP--UDP-N-acetylglucosamine O-acyltransferase [Verrucomicrobiae bacterium]|nr:acyl-ACP--UDP-N-acetylglucosamine O-acyltransferase [Verrucomicrobiae bacterium]